MGERRGGENREVAAAVARERGDDGIRLGQGRTLMGPWWAKRQLVFFLFLFLFLF
jgi:hypothetical protein